jgi:hypothetical protein
MLSDLNSTRGDRFSYSLAQLTTAYYNCSAVSGTRMKTRGTNGKYAGHWSFEVIVSTLHATRYPAQVFTGVGGTQFSLATLTD